MARSATLEDHPSQADEVTDGMVQLLGHRFGDGLVYLREQEERGLLANAMRLGLVSPDGYITPKGQSVLALHEG